MQRLLFFCLPLLLLSCARAPVSVRTEKLGPKHLASYHVETPDPLRCTFFKGQQLVLSWHFCKHKIKGPLRLKLLLIRANHTLEVIKQPLACLSGTKVFYFLGRDWCIKGEILTWRAEIYDEDTLVGLHYQKPWVDWINDRA